MLLTLAATHAMAEDSCSPWVARVVSVEGRVEAKRAGGTAWVGVAPQQVVCAGDSLRAAPRSRAGLRLRNETVARLDADTTLTLRATPQTPEQPSWLDLIRGAIHLISRVPRSLEIDTPFVNAAIEGTEFMVRVDREQTGIWVFEGQVLARNSAGQLSLSGGQVGFAKRGQAPVLRTVTRPRDAVQWALYYPPLFDVGATAARVPALAEALRRYGAQDLPGAFTALEAVPAKVRDGDYFSVLAGLLLSVGRVAEAREVLDQAESSHPAAPPAFAAVRAIIALARNDIASARAFADQALAQAPQRAVAHIAHAYVDQADFRLTDALARAEQATAIAPDNALAWARVAELRLSLGELDAALEAAKTAVARGPELSATQGVLGFARLVRVEVTGAAEAFERAIALDQADPLPRLGLGLAKIRRGLLAEGRESLEVAAALDPSDALVRSYLGKAYFEERRGELAASQLDMAKGLDPNDPTAWFYDAIRKQSENRPVEALHDLQASIEKNDNRAVYRSRLMLDSDLAARSASRGRIYTELGFDQLALVEGFNSVSVDPGNHSGHRLLADTYATLPRHELARVSELLQAQLRQPLNITPIQPQLAEARSFIFQGAGPSEPAFNEFNPLFVRDGFSLHFNGVTGGNNSHGHDTAISGIVGPVSVSLGRFHYISDGFRENNDQHQDTDDVFAQVQLTPSTSVQAEYRTREFTRGDLTLRFDPEDFSTAQRQTDHEKWLRFGLRQVFSPHSDLIVNVRMRRFDNDTVVPATGFTTTVHNDRDGHIVEAQYLHALAGLRFIAGAGTSQQDVHDNSVTEGSLLHPLFGLIPFTTTSTTREVIEHKNVHAYANVGLWDSVNLTLGAGLVSYKDAFLHHVQVNPKLGLIWSPTESTTVRAAAFRGMARPAGGEQTIEPTQVAGFNQLFDDPPGTDMRRYGLAVDQTFSSDLYGGAELSLRDFRASGFDLSTITPTFIEVDHHEQLGRAYLYWTPHPRWALRSQYQYERLDQSPELATESFTEITTHRFIVGGRFFHPSGLKASLDGTYVDQTGKFTPRIGGPGTPAVRGHDHFWSLDASLGYRLPRRWGTLGLSVKNLLGASFSFQDTDADNPTIPRERLVLLKASLSF